MSDKTHWSGDNTKSDENYWLAIKYLNLINFTKINCKMFVWIKTDTLNLE